MLVTGPSLAGAQQDRTAEAAVFFRQGNEAYRRAQRLTGTRRLAALHDAQASYASTLAVVRSRNALFNAALVALELDDPTTTFRYATEVLTIADLSEADRTEAEALLRSIAPRVAILEINSSPAGAEIVVDRSDLAPVGRTPIRIAVSPGPHRLVLQHDGYEALTVETTALLGETVAVQGDLAPLRYNVRFESPVAIRDLRVDGNPSEQLTSLPAGVHELQSTSEDGRRTEQTFRIERSSVQQLVELRWPDAVHAIVELHSEVDARFLLDDEAIGEGMDLQVRATPGLHVVTALLPQGRFRRSVEVPPLGTARVQFLSPPERPSVAAPWVFGGLTVASAAVFSWLGATALSTGSDYRNQCPSATVDCSALFDTVEQQNLTADVALAVTSVLAITTIVSLIWKLRDMRHYERTLDLLGAVR